MDRATPAVVAFKEVIDSKLLAPVQRILFTGELEPVEIEIDRSIPEDETEIDDGISLVKLVEEFRQPVVDRAILSAVNLGVNTRMENGLLGS